jgi:AhpD family alkylhydroperoxidase
MPNLEALLARTGLAAPERLLVLAKVAIWPGDLRRLTACVRRARDLAMPRVHLEEVMLQAVLFCGFPRVINAFKVLHEEWPPVGLRDAAEPGAGIGCAAGDPDGGGLPPADRRPAGDALFDTIYGEHAEAVRSMLLSYHGELHEFVLDTAYGRILSRPALSPRVRELMAIGVLAHTDQVPQLVAHGRGALRFGADHHQVREAIFSGTEDADYADTMLRRITRIHSR